MTQQVVLSAQQLLELRRLCINPLLELGSTLRPEHLQCARKRISTRELTVKINFSEHAAAERWNLLHEEQIRLEGHIFTLALAAASGYAGGMLGLAGGTTLSTAVAIGQSELQARIWYPKVYKGWSLARRYRFEYEQYPRRVLYVQWLDIIYDESGVEQERHEHRRHQVEVGDPFGLPVKLAENIMNQASQYIVKTFK